jgi:transposase-like protein
VRDYQITADEAYVTGTFGRFKYPPWGLKGGAQGSPNYMEMIHADGASQIFGKTAQYKLQRGEVARLVTGTGGGYGDPHQRPEEAVLDDVRDGYVTKEMAEAEYGIVVDPHTHTARRHSRHGMRTQPETRPVTEGFSPTEKSEAVMGILRGETSVPVVALRLNVEQAEVEDWVDDFLRAGQGALGSARNADNDQGSDVPELRAMVRDLAEELSKLRSSLRDRR